MNHDEHNKDATNISMSVPSGDMMAYGIHSFDVGYLDKL